MIESFVSQAAFYFFAALTVGSAILVVSLKNIMRAAFALLFSLCGVAGLYALLGADFLAAAQVLIYVGGILILILFGVMLTQRIYGTQAFGPASQIIPGAVISAAVVVSLLAVIWSVRIPRLTLPTANPTTPMIGELLLTRYMLPFEVTSVLLLVALVGAAVLARKEVKK